MRPNILHQHFLYILSFGNSFSDMPGMKAAKGVGRVRHGTEPAVLAPVRERNRRAGWPHLLIWTGFGRRRPPERIPGPVGGQPTGAFGFRTGAALLPYIHRGGRKGSDQKRGGRRRRMTRGSVRTGYRITPRIQAFCPDSGRCSRPLSTKVSIMKAITSIW